MVKQLLLALSLLLIPTLSYAQESVPPLSINGGDTPVKYGELIKLQVVKIDNPPASLTETQYDWKVFNADGSEKSDIYLSDDKKTLLLSSGTDDTKYTVVISAAYLFVTKNDKDATSVSKLYTSGIITKSVIVANGPGPLPPGPQPDPVPVIPDGKFKLAAVAYNSTTGIKSSVKAKMAAELAANYTAVGADIKSGVVKTLADAYTSLKNKNQASFAKIGDTSTNWTSFSQATTQAVYDLYTTSTKNGKPLVLADYSDAFNEIASGLSLVK